MTEQGELSQDLLIGKLSVFVIMEILLPQMQ
jgi:hypothetical protein